MKIQSVKETALGQNERVACRLAFSTEVRYPNAAPRLVSLQEIKSADSAATCVKAMVAGLPLERVRHTADRIAERYDVPISCEMVNGKIQVAAMGNACNRRSVNLHEAMLVLVTELPFAESEMSTYMKTLREVLFCDIISEQTSAQEGATVTMDEVSVNGNVVKVVLGITADTLKEAEGREAAIKDRLWRLEYFR